MENEIKNRLDNEIVKLKQCTKTQASKWIKDGLVSVNDKVVTKAGYILKSSDVVKLNLSDNEVDVDKKQALKTWKHQIPIVYEDEWIYIVNKPSGVITYPTSFETEFTLANALKSLFKHSESIFKEPYRFGILHRLDKDTAGLIMVAKNQKSYDTFSTLIQNKEVTRKYLAIITGRLKTKTVEVQAPLKRVKETNKMEVSVDYDAKDATTIFKTVEEYKHISLVSCELKTGRTHQIRVHAKYINNPIVNDPLYGNGKATKYGQFLIANEISFNHPFLKKEIKINLEIPKEFKEYIKKHGV